MRANWLHASRSPRSSFLRSSWKRRSVGGPAVARPPPCPNKTSTPVRALLLLTGVFSLAVVSPSVRYPRSIGLTPFRHGLLTTLPSSNELDSGALWSRANGCVQRPTTREPGPNCRLTFPPATSRERTPFMNARFMNARQRCAFHNRSGMRESLICCAVFTSALHERQCSSLDTNSEGW